MPSFLDSIRAARNYAADIDWFLRSEMPERKSEPVSDGLISGPVSRLDLGRPTTIHFGCVTDYIAYANWYKVLPENGTAPLPCCALSNSPMGPVGARSLGQLGINQRVVFILHPGMFWGAIIGVIPDYSVDPRLSLSDFISLQSRCGIQVDGCHRFPFSLPDNGGITDWSSGRPSDGTSIGESGWMSEAGVAIFIDSAMAFLRAGETTGVWAFYRDQMLRVAGHNLQIRSLGMETEAFDDEGEYNVCHGYTPYFWEALGAWAYGQTIHRELTAEEAQLTQPHYSPIEPLFDDMQPFHRSRTFKGYLGQGGFRSLALPPSDTTVVNRYSLPKVLPGVFAENVSLTGAYFLRSAKSITLAKRVCIPTPKAIRRPNDPSGDGPTVYKAAGMLGAGEEHDVNGELDTSTNIPAMEKLMGLMDGHSYSSNWEAVHAFHYHKKEWFIPEEHQIDDMGGASQQTPDFTSLATNSFLSAADEVLVKVDHRYGDVKYFPNMSYLHLGESGELALGDGFGTEIRMACGNLYLTCPGDIFLQPGRSVISLAGKDFNVRAKNCIDLSTTVGKISVRAGDLLQMKGNGLLFEGGGGDVTFSAPDDSIIFWADLVYIRAGIAGPGSGIYLDSGEGTGLIATYSKTFERYLDTAAFDYFGLSGVVVSGHSYSASGVIISGNLSVDGCGSFNGNVFAQDWFISVAGHIATFQASSTGSLITPLTGASLTSAQVVIAATIDSSDDVVDTGTASYIEEFTDCVYAIDGPGSDPDVFRFRTTAQFGTTDLFIFEVRWQQMARLSGQAMPVWTELGENIGDVDGPTYPYPGKERMLDNSALRRSDLSIFDVLSGTSAPRDDAAYADAAYGESEDVVLDGNYMVVQ